MESRPAASNDPNIKTNSDEAFTTSGCQGNMGHCTLSHVLTPERPRGRKGEDGGEMLEKKNSDFRESLCTAKTTKTKEEKKGSDFKETVVITMIFPKSKAGV